MKFKIEKNIKIINELIAYFYKFGTTDVHIDLNSDSKNSYFNIYGKIDKALLHLLWKKPCKEFFLSCAAQPVQLDLLHCNK